MPLSYTAIRLKIELVNFGDELFLSVDENDAAASRPTLALAISSPPAPPPLKGNTAEA
jgi:hypothetical protein